jgi:hypothetical protein
MFLLLREDRSTVCIVPAKQGDSVGDTLFKHGIVDAARLRRTACKRKMQIASRFQLHGCKMLLLPGNKHSGENDAAFEIIG